MPDTNRSRFFIVPFDPDVPIEEVPNAGIAQKRLKDMGQMAMAVGVEFLATGYKQLVGKQPQLQAVEALMRRVLRGQPKTVLATRQFEAWKAKKLGEHKAKVAKREEEKTKKGKAEKKKKE